MIYTDGDWYEGDWVDDLSQFTVIFQSMETENIFIVMEPSMKVNGRRIFKSFKTERRMDLVNIFGQMAKVMKETFNLIYFMDLGIKFSITIRKYTWTDGR